MTWLSFGATVGPRLFTQASIVKLLDWVKSKTLTFPRLIPPPLGRPLNEKEEPSLPVAKATPLSTVPSCLPKRSFPLPSPGHQLTAPGGSWTQPAATVG